VGTPGAIVLDGQVDEWPADRWAMADADYLYLRVRLEGELVTPQANSESLSIMLDLDADATTGERLHTPRAAEGLGADVEIVFSPRREGEDGDEDGGLERGVAVITHRTDGVSERHTHAAAGLIVAPTCASDWFEMRLSRHALAGAGMPGYGLASAGRVGGISILRDASGDLVGWSDRFEIEAPSLSSSEPRASVSVPVKKPGTLRVASWNVLHSSPMKDPGPFDRALSALDPDVVLVQEWNVDDEQEIEAWFNALMPDATWEVAGNAGGLDAGGGVAIASRYPITRRLDRAVTSNVDGREQPVRVAAAVIDTPEGPGLFASIHLKCCGGPRTAEETRRVAEAAEVQATLESLAREVGVIELIVVGGDSNLVGTREPLDALRRGLDRDGSDLSVAPAMVLGDRHYSTWRDDDSSFAPGRLDYVCVGDAAYEIAGSFVLDARVLSDGTLTRLGIERADTDTSDHHPVVVDLRRR
jgi:exonuclease III